MRCKFKEVGKEGHRTVYQCRRCKRPARSTAPAERVIAKCADGFGDWLHVYLGQIGITTCRINRLKKMLGLSKPCGCKKRQRWLNDAPGRFYRWLKPTTRPAPKPPGPP